MIKFTKITTFIFIASFASTECMEKPTVTSQLGPIRIHELCQELSKPKKPTGSLVFTNDVYYSKNTTELLFNRLCPRPGNLLEKQANEEDFKRDERIKEYQDHEREVVRLLVEIKNFEVKKNKTPFLPRVEEWLNEESEKIKLKTFATDGQAIDFMVTALVARKLTNGLVKIPLISQTIDVNGKISTIEDRLFGNPQTAITALTTLSEQLKKIAAKPPEQIFTTTGDTMGVAALRFGPLLLCSLALYKSYFHSHHTFVKMYFSLGFLSRVILRREQLTNHIILAIINRVPKYVVAGLICGILPAFFYLAFRFPVFIGACMVLESAMRCRGDKSALWHLISQAPGEISKMFGNVSRLRNAGDYK
jgi:hypothetical protein